MTKHQQDYIIEFLKLEDWPTIERIITEILGEMEEASRERIVTEALQDFSKYPAMRLAEIARESAAEQIKKDAV